MNYLNKPSWDNSIVGELMVWMTDNQADGQQAAQHFLKENPGIWKSWVSPEVAEKVEAAL